MGRSTQDVQRHCPPPDSLFLRWELSDGLPVQFGIASFNDADASKAWLSDSNNGGAVDLTGSDQGAYSDSAINTYWSDTTNMDNLRGADITGDIAGTIETISANVDHTASDNAQIALTNNAPP